MTIESRLETLERRLRDFYERLDRFGLEWFRKFYAPYRGIVMDNKDPEQRGRVLATIPDVGHTLELFPKVWIDPMFAAAGTDRGSLMVPEVGDSVRVWFDSGNAGTPIGYLGGWFGQGELPKELAYSASGYPERRGFVSRLGHAVWVSDEPGKEEVHLTWHKAASSDTATNTGDIKNRSISADRTKGSHADIAMTPDGSVTTTNKSKSSISLDATNKRIQAVDENHNVVTMDGQGISLVDKQSNKVEMSSAGIKLTDKNGNVIFLDGTNGSLKLAGNFQVQSSGVALDATGNLTLGKGAAYSVPLGEILIAYLGNHFHTSGSPGTPTSPPVVPPPSTMLSTAVKTK